MNRRVGTPRVNSISTVLINRSGLFFRSFPRIIRKPSAKAIPAPVTAASSVVSSPFPKKRQVVARAKKDQYLASSCPVTANCRITSAVSTTSAAIASHVKMLIRFRAAGPGGSYNISRIDVGFIGGSSLFYQSGCPPARSEAPSRSTALRRWQRLPRRPRRGC